MSLSSDVRDAFSKPHGMQLFGENHPVLLALGVMIGLVTALLTATSLLLR